MSLEKRAVRQHLKQQRAQLRPDFVAAAGAAVCAQLRNFTLYQRAQCVALYIATIMKWPTAAIITEAAQNGRTIYLPKASSEGLFTTWQPGTDLQSGRNSVFEPSVANWSP